MSRESSFISIPNWDDLQHYTDRSPPWIKLHNKLLENYDFECLPDASKAHLVCIWLLASRTNNKINADPKWIARKIGANTKVDIDVLIDAGFLVINQPLQTAEQSASATLADCLSRERVEREREREQSRTEVRLHNSSQQGGCEFQKFWAEYPKKKSKGAAEKAWKKLTQEEREAAMYKLPIAKNSRDWTKDGGQFIPYPASWLNAKGWEDDFVVAGSGGGWIDKTRSQAGRTFDSEVSRHDAR